MNRGLKKLKPYPFERLATIRSRVKPPEASKLIDLSIGEPQHATPSVILDALVDALGGISGYPKTRGLPALREAITTWASRRFHLETGSLTPEHHVLPVNGTREALFAIVQCSVDVQSGKDLVLVPNPFYQIYEGAALLSGAKPYYLPCPAARGFQPHWEAVPDEIWARAALVFVCSPANPSGAVLTTDDYQTLTSLADRYRFTVVADECYSELYLDETAPPLGLLEYCARYRRNDFRLCLAMHSLSKRSSVPGLRSGFVAGDSQLIDSFFHYRTYQGGAMPLHVQHASMAAWSDENHVKENRARYREKFEQVLAILSACVSVEKPPAGFYLWPELEIDGITACERLLGEAGVLVLPGDFLARPTSEGNPGQNRIRLALVPEIDVCVEAAQRISNTLR